MNLEELNEQLVRRNRQLSALNAVATVASRSLDLETTMRDALDQVLKAMNLQTGGIFLLDEESNTLHLAHHQGAPEAYVDLLTKNPLALGEGVTGKVAQLRTPLASPDLTADARAWERPIPAESQLRGLLGVPLVSQDKVLGVLVVSSPEVRPFTTDEIQLLDSIGGTLGAAIENASLHRKTEQALAKISAQKELLDSVINNAQDGIMLLDEQRRIQLFSPGCERITGWKAEEVKGLPCFERIDCRHEGRPIDHEKECPVVKLLSGDQEASYMEMVIVRRDGQERWIGASSALIKTGPVDGTRVVTIWRDITALKEMDQMKSAIISTVSHQLRTPLTSIRALSELLAGHHFAPSETQELATSINRESMRLTELVDNMLNVARIEGGRITCDIQPVDLGAVVRQSVEALETQKLSHTFELELPSTLPAILADPEPLRLIVDNLLSNAVKYSPPGSRVFISASSQDDAVEVRVRDQGPGIPESEFERVFEKFYRLDRNDARRVGGVGLGLYIVKSLVEMQGGKVSVESEQGKGSTFIFALPKAKPGTYGYSLDGRANGTEDFDSRR